jgi:class 3 adenylate cyclase/tetratricopeptide (TPR) repeat protein
MAPATAQPAHAGSPTHAAPVAERRLVSVLFADLVGFTTLSEGRDPEAVRELLSQYFELAAEVIGRYGGTVEKFIGDAVMAVWGAPSAHEDDSERSVRAALELVDAVRQLGEGIQARAGVLTGEAAVTIGARGQGMVAGDLVNTASRVQGIAPAGSVLVGEATHQATAGAIAYEEAGEHLLKGKVAPVPVWRAIRVVAERKGRGRDDRLEAPFVGRDAELRLLKDLFHATSRERRVRLVSITGQAGIGKSRLAWEFLKYVDGVVERVLWHEGRSPSYGEGITFWALGEMIRSRAGLLESDDPATTRTRIAASLLEHVPDPGERDRLEPALLALLGVAEAPAGGAPELFWAWRTYFERLASEATVALLFEDLQWADPGTLDFIEHLLEWSRNVPILIITLSRPELLERRPDWGAGKRAFLALDLQPLDEASMRQLLGGLAPELPEPAVRSIVARAEGIPLYAVETIRMLVADGRLVEREGGGFAPAGELGELAVPGTLHALIAARLDGLEPTDRALLQDAAVLGQSFQIPALSAVSGVPAGELAGRLERLVRSDLIRVEVDPRSPERGQYAFLQALIREVAYATLALRDRRSRHLAAARHFESIGDEELAGALAAHYLAAYHASTEGPEAEALAGQARIALRAAAERATSLGSLTQSITFMEQAAEVTPDPAERADLHERAGRAARRSGLAAQGLRHYDTAFELLEGLGDRSGQARIAAWQGDALIALRRREEALAHLEAAFSDFSDLGEDDLGRLQIMRFLVTAASLLDRHDVADPVASELLATAERLALAELAASALISRAQSALYAGRAWEARALTQGSLELFEEAGSADGVLQASAFYATIVALDNPVKSVAVQRDAIDVARREGRRATEALLVGNAGEDARRTGEWDWAEAQLAQLLDIDVDPETTVMATTGVTYLRMYRGELEAGALDEMRAVIETMSDTDLQASVSDIEGLRRYLAGDFAGSVPHLLHAADISPLNLPYILPSAGRTAVLARDRTTAQAAVDRMRRHGIRGRAIVADVEVIISGIMALDGDRDGAMAGYRHAMTTYHDLGLPWDEAKLGFEAASMLGTDDAELVAWTDRARTTFTRLRANPMVALLDRVADGARSPVVAPSTADTPAPGLTAAQDSAAG